MTMTELADPNDWEARVEASRAAVREAVAFIASNAPTIETRSGPIAALLKADAEKIRRAVDSGYSYGAIAKKLHEAGVKFEEASIRLRIAKMFPKDGAASASGHSGRRADRSKAKPKPGSNAGRSAPVAPQNHYKHSPVVTDDFEEPEA
jgi:hypothetical protein